VSSDCGAGHGLRLSLGEAHENAIEEAEAEGIEAIEEAE
jgi:hypothetical protein